jgi:hypothetical protein
MQISIVVVVLFCTPLMSSAEYPMLFGVTQGSKYKHYLRIYWFEAGAAATYSIDGGSPSAYTKGAQLSANGNYRVELSITDGETTYVNPVEFEIDSTLSGAAFRTLNQSTATMLDVEFVPDTYSGNPIIVVWAEDNAGNFLQNLYVSTAAATNYMRFTNNIVQRPQAVPYWAHKTCPPTASGSDTIYIADPVTPLPAELDAVSGATEKDGFTLNTRAILENTGHTNIRILLEINQSFDDGWYFASGNPIQEETDAPSGPTFGSDRFFAGSEEPSMVYAVDVDLDAPGIYTTIEPAGYGHYGGRTGTLYTDFYALDDSTERYKFDHAHQMADHVSVTVHQHNLMGDLTGDAVVDLTDAILGLKICTGDSLSPNIESDVGTNNRIGLEEVNYILEKVTGLRQ